MESCPKYLLLAILIIAVILDTIAVAIPYWTVSFEIHYGLWKLCNDGNCTEIPESFDGIQIIQGLHMSSLVLGVITSILYIITEVVGVINAKIVKSLIAKLNISTGFLIMVANGYMAKRATLYPACHVLSMVSAVFFVYVGGFLTSAKNFDSS